MSKHNDIPFTLTDECDTTCNKKPLPKTICLEHCFAVVDGERENIIDIGTCSGDPCATRSSPTSPDSTLCCERETYQIITVECLKFHYNITRTLSCGCSSCSGRPDVQLNGAVRIVNPEQPYDYIIPGRNLTFYIGSLAYSTEPDGSFTEVIMRTRESIVLEFPGGITEGYVAHAETIPTLPGMTDHDILVVLQTLPQPVVFNASVQQTLAFGMPPVVNMTIPEHAMMMENGDLVEADSIVLAYLTFSNPLLDDGLALAPGSFTTAESDGFTRHLQTAGVLSVYLIDGSTNQTLVLTGDIQLHWDTAHTGDGFSAWRFNQDDGNWDNSVVNKNGSAAISLSTKRIRNINLDKLLEQQNRCFIKVVVYSDFDKRYPAEDISVRVYTKDSSGLKTISRHVGHTDSSGVVCLSIECDREHEITLSTVFPYETSGIHNLPRDFIFNNMGHRKVIFKSPPWNNPMTSNGPIYFCSSCLGTSEPSYNFAFFLQAYSKRGWLLEALPVPGLVGSWYDDEVSSSDRSAVMVRVRVDVRILLCKAKRQYLFTCKVTSKQMLPEALQYISFQPLYLFFKLCSPSNKMLSRKQH